MAAKMTVHLITFSDESMSRSRNLCNRSALDHGVDNLIRWESTPCKGREPDVNYLMEVMPETEYWQRGFGHWKWKPAIIADALRLKPIVQDGDILIYSDAGVEFINNVNHIIDRMDQDVWLFGNQWEHAHWCKADIVEAIWPRTEPLLVSEATRRLDPNVDREYQWWRFGKQVQASVILFRVSDYSRKFVKEWLDWCLFEGGRLIDDSPSRTPNHPEFRENRHDQAILTTLAYREGIKLHWWPSSYNDGAFIYERGDYPDEGYPVLFSHHRKRNHEWAKCA